MDAPTQFRDFLLSSNSTAAYTIWTSILHLIGDGDSDGPDDVTNASIIGIIVAISGNVVISLALNCQKLAHRRLEREREEKRRQRAQGSSAAAANGRARSGQRRLSFNSHASIQEDYDAEVDDHDEADDDDEERTRVGETSQRHSPESGEENDYGESIPFPEQSRPALSQSPSSFRERAHSLLLETEPLLVVAPQGTSPHGSVRSAYGSQGRAQSLEGATQGKRRRGHSLLERMFRAPKSKGTNASDLDVENAAAIPVQVQMSGRLDSGSPRPPPNELKFVDAKPPDRGEFESDYLKSKLWWFGFLLMIVGELGNFISYAFAPASVVAPLGTFALIANCFFAPIMLKEKFRKSDLIGVGLAILGAVTVVLSANPSDTRLDPEGLIHAICQTPFVILAGVYILGAATFVALSSRPVGNEHVYIDVGACALFGGFTVLATKATSSLITLEGGNVVKEWILYPVLAVLIVTGVGQIRYLNRALMKFDSKIVIPTQFVLFNLSVITSSAVMYGDFQTATLHQMVTFFYGCGATFAGVFLLTWGNMGRADDAGSIGREQNEGQRVGRAQLVLPSTPSRPSRALPVLRSTRSSVSLVGLSPAQRLLLVRPISPPPEGVEEG